MTFLLDWVRIKLNRLTAVVSPPLDTPDSPRKKVLVVHCHPEQDSLSSRLLGAVVSGLQEANHEVRVKHLYGDNDVTKTYGGGAFSPVLTAAEKNSYANPEVIRQLDTPEGIAAVTDKAVGEAIADLRWCNALVFVYPTWWFNFPATLKGYFDRVYRPGVVFTHEHSPVFMKPKLTHIKTIGVVTTYGSNVWIARYIGDSGRNFMSRCLRTFCHPDCQLLWVSIYSAGSLNKDQLDNMLASIQKRYKRF